MVPFHYTSHREERMTQLLERHELSEIWGDLPEPEREELKKSIQDIGVLEPITLHDGKVLDGWHRYVLAKELGLDVQASECGPDVDPKDFVIAKNSLRRHLSAEQRAAAVLSVHDWLPRGRRTEENMEKMTEDEMARKANVSKRTLQRVKSAMRDGHGDAIRKGETTTSKLASEDRRRKQEEQQATVERDMEHVPPDVRPETKVRLMETELREVREQNELLQERLGVREQDDEAEDPLVIQSKAIEKHAATIKALRIELGKCNRRKNELSDQVRALQKKLANG